MKATIERLHNKLESLLANYQQLKEELKTSNQKVDVLSKQLDEHNQTIQQLNEKNKVLKLSSSIQGEQGDNKAAKQKINELVREIDRALRLFAIRCLPPLTKEITSFLLDFGKIKLGFFSYNERSSFCHFDNLKK